MNDVIFTEDAPGDIQEAIVLFRNLYTIRTILRNSPEFPYVERIREANDVAILAVEAKMQLYSDSQTR